jgi:bifunctional non-homologous end joining protein LigD
MLWRVRNSRGRPTNAPAAFIPPCQPSVAQRPPSGPGWAHELKHDGYRLQLHVRDGRVRLYTMNGNDWTKRYSRIVEEASRIKGTAILEAASLLGAALSFPHGSGTSPVARGGSYRG